MEPIEIIRIVNFVLGVLFTVCYSYQFFYLAVPFFKKDKPHAPVRLHRYAVLICARNERAVIGPLLESLRRQDYPTELVTVFVAADNCTDDTAAVARAGGAVVYERFDSIQVGKGYAMDWLLDNIRRDFGEVFDGFFVFDADNLLEPGYLSAMNRSFCDGYDILTSYRNSKNFGDNWISAGYALWFLREAQFLNHARALLGTSCAVSGTGFLFSREVLARRGGWHFHLLTEDIEFTVANVVAGERIGYCPDAVLYDEQPVTFRQSWRQRLRWAKGYIQVFQKYGAALLRGALLGVRRASLHCAGEDKKSAPNALQRRGACFDMAMAIMPAIVLTVIGLAANLGVAVLGLLAGQNLWVAIQSVLEMLCNTYLLLLALGGITTVTQWRNIHTSPLRKVLYTFTFPLFMMTYIPISFAALFQKVEWKPIEHKVALTLREVQSRAS